MANLNQLYDHTCTQDDRIRDTIRRVDKLEERSDNTKLVLTEIKEFQSKLMWSIIGSMGVAILNLVVALTGKGG